MRANRLIRSGSLLLAFAYAGTATGQAAAAPSFDAWNISYGVPAGWQLAQQQGRVHGLSPASPGSVVYVAPGPYQSFTDVAAELPKAFTALGLTGMPTSQPSSATLNGMQAMTASYAAQSAQGLVFDVYITALLTGQGSGVVVMGVAPQQGAAQMRPAVDQVAQSVVARGAPTSDPRAVAALRGRWIFYSGRASPVTSPSGGSSRSYEETVEFDGSGRFAWRSSASVSVTAPGGSAGGANANSDQGSYTVIGSTLVVRGQQGMASYEVQILADRIIADGRTFFRAN